MREPRRGAVLVEAALVLPLLLTLAIGMIQLGLVLHAQNVLTAAAQDGARVAAADGRSVNEGVDHARRLLAAGLGSRAARVSVSGAEGRDAVRVSVHAGLPLRMPWVDESTVRLGASATLTKERFRPGGGTR